MSRTRSSCSSRRSPELSRYTVGSVTLRWRGAGTLLLALACSDDAPGRAPLPAPFREPVPLPLPGCEAFDYALCDVRLPECLDNLVQIASCVRGADAAAPGPTVTVLSRQEAEQSLLAALAAAPPPSPNHFERALVLLGLTEPSAFEPETAAARLAQTYAAYYLRDRGELVVIDQGGTFGATGRGSAAVQALVLHELIHALQDREHDLDAFALAHQQDSDGNLSGSCVIEGEAQLHQLRLYSALWGIDVSRVDWPRELQMRRDAAEEGVFLEANLYTASLLSVPYAHGAEYVERIWAEQGTPGVRALFTAPPANMREILAALWEAGTSRQASPRQVAPLAPGGLRREAYSSLGAWGVYLFARPRLTTLERARELALGWSGDLLEAFSFGERQTAVSWTLELATEADAAQLAEALVMGPQVRVLRSAAQLRVLMASAELPSALVAASAAPP